MWKRKTFLFLKRKPITAISQEEFGVVLCILGQNFGTEYAQVEAHEFLARNYGQKKVIQVLGTILTNHDFS